MSLPFDDVPPPAPQTTVMLPPPLPPSAGVQPAIRLLVPPPAPDTGRLNPRFSRFWESSASAWRCWRWVRTFSPFSI